MSPDLCRYRAVIFDLDGTLYEARRLRLRMVLALAGRVLRHPGEIGLPWRLQVYRRERERLADDEVRGIAQAQFERPARRLGIPAERLAAEVEEWIERRPLRHLRRCRYPGTAALFERLRGLGRRIAVLSDYPADDKLRALELQADVVVTALDPDVDRLKPHPAGLLRVLERLALPPADCLLIGDRDDRDGACARRVGVDFLLRSRRSGPGRFRHYRELLAGLQAG